MLFNDCVQNWYDMKPHINDLRSPTPRELLCCTAIARAKEFASIPESEIQHLYSFVLRVRALIGNRANPKSVGYDDGYHKFEFVSCMILSQGLVV